LLVDVVFGSSLFENAQRFGQMFIQSDGFVAELADEEVLFFDLLFEREGSFELFLRGLDGCFCGF
jgi:hypothetical protein